MLTVYGIKSCDSCRAAKKFLDDRDIEYRFHDFREDGLDIAMLRRWSERLGWERLLNRKSLTWRKIPEVDRQNMGEEQALAAMLERPTLVKRPVAEAQEFIAVGFSEQQFADLLEQL